MERMPSACSCSPFPGPARLLAALSLWPRQPAPAAPPSSSPLQGMETEKEENILV